jgi:inhibitor of cysteine peptidase
MAEVVISQADQGNTVEVQQGDLIVIQIDENPTTGYRWELGSYGQQVVEFVDSDYQSPTGAGMGGGGTRSFRFRASTAGRSTIQLRLRRSWEPEDAFLETFDVNISVQ